MLLNPASLAIQRSGYFTVTEERGWWIKGRNDTTCFELSFEDSVAIRQARKTEYFPRPRIYATYLGLWSGRQTLAEFQLGTWTVRPVDDHHNLLLSKLLVPLVDVNPIAVAAPAPTMFILGGAAPRPPRVVQL